MTSARFDIALNEPDFEIVYQNEGTENGEPLLQSIEEPFEYFLEHPLRMLRACRLSSELGTRIEPRTLATMKSLKMRLFGLDADAVREELEALLLGEHVHDALMETVDVLCAVIPEVAACRDFPHRSPYHIYDVWEHIAWVVQRSPRTSLARWAALFHDIGKPAACFMEGSRAHFYGHARLSMLLARPVMERLNMSADFVDRVLALVKLHDVTIEATPESVRDFMQSMGGDPELFRALCKLKQADALAHSQRGEKRRALSFELERVLDQLTAESAAQ